MDEWVIVADQIYEQQGTKLVAGADGTRQIPAGQAPGPEDDILMVMGEPCFEVRFTQEVLTDDDVPDEVGLALRAVAKRLTHVMSDGREVPDEDGPVEFVTGPAIHNGAVALYLDTDDRGGGRAMITAMARIFVEELTPLAMPLTVSGSSATPGDMGPAWRTSGERS